MKRLRHVVVAARLEPRHSVSWIAPSREKQHRCAITPLAKGSTYGEAVNFREHHIKNDQSTLLVPKPVEGTLTVRECVNAIAFRRQVVDDSGGQVRVVFYYENSVEKLRRSVHVGSAGATGQAITNCAPCPTPSL